MVYRSWQRKQRFVYGFRAGFGGLIDKGKESSGGFLYRYFRLVSRF
ncbi:hypothetical protein OROHE_008513 [Orobanche hederae]